MHQPNLSFRLIGIGEVLWDILPSGRQLGGAPANFAYHAHALGGNGIIVSAIGKDELGEEIVNQLRNVQLATDFLFHDDSHPTGTVTVEVDADGQPDYIIHENVAWDYLKSSDKLRDLATCAYAVCFGSLAQRSPTTRDSIQHFLEQTSPQCLRIFDINLRQSYYDAELIRRSLQLANILKLNDDELHTLAQLFDLLGPVDTQLKQLLQEFSLKLIALTRGNRGSVLLTEHEQAEHPGFKVEVVDTIGAGDAFSAALAIGLLKKRSLDQINDYANRIASYVCTQPGATPALPESIVSII